jgi:hypothetical protein
VYFGRTKKVTVSPMGRGIAIGGTF